MKLSYSVVVAYVHNYEGADINSKQILIDYEGNGANYHRRGDLGATIIPSRKARDNVLAPRSPRR